MKKEFLSVLILALMLCPFLCHCVLIIVIWHIALIDSLLSFHFQKYSPLVGSDIKKKKVGRVFYKFGCYSSNRAWCTFASGLEWEWIWSKVSENTCWKKKPVTSPFFPILVRSYKKLWKNLHKRFHFCRNYHNFWIQEIKNKAVVWLLSRLFWSFSLCLSLSN